MKQFVFSALVATPVLAFATAAHAGDAAPIAFPTVVAQTVPGTVSADPAQPAPTTTAAPAAPTTDTPPAAEEEKKAPPKTWIDGFAGSSIFTQTGATLGTLVKSYQQNYNPTVQTFTSFSPRYKINKNWQLRGRIAATYEWTNSDSTTYAHELELSDALVQLWYQGIKAFDLGGGVNLKLSPYVGLGLPTSKQSRYRTLYVSPSLGLQAAMPVEKLFGGEWTFIMNGSVAHPLYSSQYPINSNIKGSRGTDTFAVNNGGPVSAEGQSLGGAAGNPSNVFVLTAIAVADYGKWSPGAFMLLSSSYIYGAAGKEIIDPNTGKPIPSLNNNTAVRNGQYFAAWLDYHFNDWLTPELGYQQARSTLAADGKFGNPFFSKYQDSTVYLGANIQLDSLYKVLNGTAGEAGVVRAQRTSPIRFY